MNRVITILLILIILVSVFLYWERSHNGNDKNISIDIQPFADFPDDLTQNIAKQLKEIDPAINIRPAIDLPASAYYAPRNRYRADSIIAFLSRNIFSGHVTIGLTGKDISTTKDKIKDWGIMGLGFRPGNACVVSSFRLKKEKLYSQFYKVCIHELGHTEGLDHCAEKTCFMRDAEGGNPTDEETSFCNKCRTFLIKKGWHLK